MIKSITKSFLCGLAFFGAGYMVWVLAWSGTDSLTASNGDVLDMNTWNTMVNKIPVWQNVPTSDTNSFDGNCFRRWQINNPTHNNIFYSTNIWANGTAIFSAATDYWMEIVATNKTISRNTNNSNTFDITKLEKMCFQ